MNIEIAITDECWDNHWRDTTRLDSLGNITVPPGISFIFLTQEGTRHSRYISNGSSIDLQRSQWGGYRPGYKSYKVFTSVWLEYQEKNPNLEYDFPVVED
jgi:hypothetical protein